MASQKERIAAIAKQIKLLKSKEDKNDKIKSAVAELTDAEFEILPKKLQNKLKEYR